MKKLTLLFTAVMLAAAPAMAQTPPETSASSPENTQVVDQSAQPAKHAAHAKKHHAKKKHGKKKHAKKHVGAKLSKAEKTKDVGNTQAGENLPPVTDNSAGPQ